MLRLTAGLLAGVTLSGLAAADGLSVTIDETKILQLKDQVATIVVGNPAIADVSMQDGDTALVFGKSFGATNIIALNQAGAQIANIRVVVSGAKERTVTLLRGREQQTLSCAPRCQATPMPGDSKDIFTALVEQTEKKAGMASGSAGGSQ
jgi:hypothetical protein